MPRKTSLCVFPDPVLRRPALPVKRFDRQLRRIVRLMAAMMRTQQHGIGIAAPQIGISMQIALVDVSSRVPGAKALVLINPKLLSFSEPYPSREGCMSIPDYTSLISRYRSVRAGWYDLDGNYREGDFTGIEAVCIQHEIDHLGGILFIDRVVSLKRDLIPRPRSFKTQ